MPVSDLRPADMTDVHTSVLVEIDRFDQWVERFDAHRAVRNCATIMELP